ncbi:MAG: sugar ABC transporter substrate-binding protein [Planctomycetaceae bacterium]|nr:sugar ABC transporter substrate-binding protein [Planctomycetaceae bacterium]
MKKAFATLSLILCLTASAWSGQTTIRVLMGNAPWTDAAETLIPQFEKETGIKVDYEKYGEDQLSQKIAVEFASGGGDVDVVNFRMMREGKMMARNGWVADLIPYVKDDKEYDIGDYSPAAIEACMVGDILTAIPTVSETLVVYYRKDIFAKHGLNPPATFAELEEVAKKLTDRKNEFYGFISRGQRSPLITQLAGYVYGFGSDWYDRATNKSLVNTPEFLEAVDFYGRMLRNYGPEGVLNMSWPQAIAVFAQGKGAIYSDFSSQYRQLLDPRSSTVADVTGIAMFPAGPRAHKFPFTTGWGIGIGGKSTKKDAAWAFIRWMTDKQRTMHLQGELAVPCSRGSVYNDPEGVKNFPEDWAKTIRDSMAHGVFYDRPTVTAVGEARDIIGEVAVTSIMGGDYARSAREADAKFQAILDRENK